jgi:DtxR family Mn-dependent transcriptional regulator
VHATAPKETLTRSVEDYLKAIYQLSPEGRAASTSDIAHLLALSAPSVSGMVKRLSELGLLEHAPYKGVQLTDAGRRAALRMVRRHRLIEAYLVRFLGYSWDAVHPEAERLEHAVSDTLVDEGEPERLRFLGELGLVPGVVVTVRERQPFGGPVTVAAAGERHTIGAELAHVVLCASGDTR